MLVDMGTGKTSVYTCVSNRWYQVVCAVLRFSTLPSQMVLQRKEGLLVLFSPSLLSAPCLTDVASKPFLFYRGLRETEEAIKYPGK